MNSYISKLSSALSLSQPLALDDPSSPPLLIYAKSGDIKKVAKLLSTPAAVDELLEERDKWEQTALHKASRRGKFDVARFLLRHGADVHSKDFIGYTPAQFAAHYRHYEILSELIMAGSDVEYDNDHTRSIMRYCRRDPNVQMVVKFALPRRKERQSKLRDLIVSSAEESTESRFPDDLALVIVKFVPSLPSFWDAPLGQADPGDLAGSGEPFRHFVDSQRESVSKLVQQSRGQLSKLQSWLQVKQRTLESQLQQRIPFSHSSNSENEKMLKIQ